MMLYPIIETEKWKIAIERIYARFSGQKGVDTMNRSHYRDLSLGLICCLALMTACGQNNADEAARSITPEHFPASPTVSPPIPTDAADQILPSDQSAPSEPVPISPTVTPIRQVSIVTAASLPEELSGYQSFFDGSEKVYIQEEALGDYTFEAQALEEGMEYSLEDILQDYRSYNWWWDPDVGTVSIELQYAALDLGDDGVAELAFSLSGATEFDWTFLLRHENGRLILCYAYGTWSRSETFLNNYGFLWGGGSNGAGDHSHDEKFIDGDGRALLIENANILSDDFSSEWHAFLEVMGEEASSNWLEVVHYEIGGETYSTYYTETELSGEEAEHFEALCLERYGTVFVTDEYVAEQKDAYIKELGISEQWLEMNEVDWQLLMVVEL